MVLNLLRRLAPATAACLLLAAVIPSHAQQRAGTTPRPDPLDPKAPVPALRYESSLPRPPLAGSEVTLGWRDANDAVARIGGWRAYAREAQQPEPSKLSAPLPAASAPAASAGPAGHGAHRGGARP
jgi:hypothetical protein